MNAPHERVLRVGHGQFDPLRGELSLDRRKVTLRPRTAALLSYLVQHGDRAVGKDELMQAVWPDAVVTEDSLVQCVKEIRRALGEAGRDWIRTLPRQGYAFVGNTPERPAPPAAQESPQLPLGPAGQRSPRAARWRLAASALAAVIVVGALALPWWRGNQPHRPPAPALSMVVMPLVNLTGDASQENAADDMTEALTDAMARLGRGGRRITVIAPSTAFTFKGKPVDARRIGLELNVSYVLEGSLRMDKTSPMLAMRLTDATNAVQLWSQDFASGAQGMPALREDVIGRVAETFAMQLVRAEARSSGRPGATRAAELLGRARALMRSPSGQGTAGMLQARTLLEEAVRHDGTLFSAWNMLAMTYVFDVRLSTTRELDLRRAAEAVERARALAPDSDAVRVVEGNLHYEQGRMKQALATFDSAIELNPNNAGAHGIRGAALVMLGRPHEALAAVNQAIRLSPRDPLLPVWHLFIGVAHLHLGDDAAAVKWLTSSVESNPGRAFGRLFLASALGISGRIAEAKAQVEELQRIRPGLTISRFRAVEPSDALAFRQQRERVYEGLRRAGMPE